MSGWTTYGRRQMLLVASGAIDPPQLYLALFVGTADPANPSAEVAAGGYTRVAMAFAPSDTNPDGVENAVDLYIGPLQQCVYRGVAVLDGPAATDGVWWWDDEASDEAVPQGSIVTFAAGAFRVSLT